VPQAGKTWKIKDFISTYTWLS